MKFSEVKKMIGKKVSSKRLKEIINKITPSEFQKEIRGKGSILDIIKRKIKNEKDS